MVEFKNFLNMKISWDSCDEGSDLETTRKSIKDAIEHVVNEENSSKIGARGGDRGFDLERVDFAKVGFQNKISSANFRIITIWKALFESA